MRKGILDSEFFIHTSPMIYLDHAATAPMDPRVLKAMLPHMRETWGNASSAHGKGREARSAIDTARRTIADILQVEPHEVIFTASGSEANSLAIFGLCEKYEETHGKAGHAVFLSVEHSCSIQATQRLRRRGWQISMLPVDENAFLDPAVLAEELREDTALVSIQWANNEVGTIQPIAECEALCKERAIPFHTDAVQPVGLLPLPVLPALTSIAAHKFYGPRGIAALIVRDGIAVAPQVLGGGQEFGLRAGSENIPAIVGMAKALELAVEEQPKELQRLTALRDFFISEMEKLPGVTLNGPRGDARLANNINVRIAGHKGETVVMRLDMEGICVSTGAACASGSAEPSHVLEAMGRDAVAANENIRMTLGKGTTEADLQKTIAVLQKIISK